MVAVWGGEEFEKGKQKFFGGNGEGVFFFSPTFDDPR